MAGLERELGVCVVVLCCQRALSEAKSKRSGLPPQLQYLSVDCEENRFGRAYSFGNEALHEEFVSFALKEWQVSHHHAASCS